ncbi:hypothetical protein BH11GEM1_BH11GEM1_03760 [soil metagenome]
MSLETERGTTANSEQFATFREDLRPFVFTGEQEGRMRRAVVTFGRIARKRSWRPAAIMIALHHSDCYPGGQGEAVEAFVAQRFARALDLLFREYFNDEDGQKVTAE